MFYAVANGDGFIYITSLDEVQMIAKHQVIGVVITGLERVRIDTKVPGNSFCLNYKAVLQPQSTSVFELANAIKDMLINNASKTHTKAGSAA